MSSHLGSQSLTGSHVGAPNTHVPSVSIALGQLRFGVLLCCWLIGLALTVQIGIWAMASFMDIRYDEVVSSPSEPPLVVQAEPTQPPSVRSPLDPVPAEQETMRIPVDPNRVPGRIDRVLNVASQLASGIGTLAALVLLPLMALGVLLAASSATHGVEKAVSAFGWALLVGLLVLPVGGALALPWEGGGLWSYEKLAALLNQRALSLGDPEAEGGNLVFFGRYLILPLSCVVGITLVGHRYSAGVRAGLIRREDLRVDPLIEQEAANIRPGSLHGGRTANAIHQAVKQQAATNTSPLPSEQPLHPRPVQQGVPPRRLI